MQIPAGCFDDELGPSFEFEFMFVAKDANGVETDMIATRVRVGVNDLLSAAQKAAREYNTFVEGKANSHVPVCSIPVRAHVSKVIPRTGKPTRPIALAVRSEVEHGSTEDPLEQEEAASKA